MVTGAWGVRGGLRIKPYAADPQALFSSKRWYWRWPEATPIPDAALSERLRGLPQPLRIIDAREQGDGVVATLHELQDRNLAEALKGLRLFVPRSSFPTADEDEFYWVDLIGLQVRNREDQCLGVVVDLLQTGPHSVLRIQPVDAAGMPDEKAPECLIPFVQAYVDRVDLAGRLIQVDWQADY